LAVREQGGLIEHEEAVETRVRDALKDCLKVVN
jgi:hypothetical protein